jgi:internalin A
MLLSRKVFRWSLCPATVAVFFATVFLTLSGCDQVESIVNDVKSEVAGDPEQEASPTVTPAESPSQPAEVPQTPAPPNPVQLVAEFKRLPLSQISDGALQKLAEVPEAAAQITELDLRATSDVLSEAGLVLIAKFPNLQSLCVAGRSMTGEAISAIAEQTMLRELDMSGSQLDSTVSDGLNGMSHLTVLKLDGTIGGDSVAAAVSSLPLEVLTLSSTPLSDAGLQEIGKIKTLKELDVSKTQVTGAAFRALKGLSLVKLNASATSFGVDGLVNLRGMQTLEELHLHSAGIIEQPKAKVFTPMPNLRILNLGSNRISGPGMHELFKGLKNLEELHLHATDVNDYGLSALTKCRNLKMVTVGTTHCTPDGARKLKSFLPECVIVLDGGTI